MRSWWMMPMALGLAACAAPPPRPDLVREQIGAELQQAVKERKTSEGKSPEAALLPPLTVSLPPQDNGQAEARFDLSVVNAPAAQVFMAIVTGTKYNMLVGPEVTGNITVNLKDVTVKEALEAIRELYGYEFSIQGNRITIQPNTLQTRVFQVNYLASRRQGATELRVTSSAITSAGPTGTATPTTTPPGVAAPVPGGTQPVTSTTSRVQTQSDADFWKDLKSALDTLVAGEGRSVVVNSLSGVVVVRALPRELRAVEQYLKATQAMVERQVMLEAKILEVRLHEQYQSGINWASFNGSQTNRLSLGVLQPGGSLGPSGTGALGSNDLAALPGLAGTMAASALGNGFVGLAFQTANFAALLNFLETQGTVSVLSSPRIATINNQKAVLKVGTDELFVTNVTTTTTSTTAGTTATPSLTLQPYFSGISLDVTPQIDDDGNIILHIHPAISTVSEKNKVVDLGTMGQYTLPLATSSVNETDSIVRVQDGNIVAIGGLMTQEQSSDSRGLPGTAGATAGNLLGQRGRSLAKRELVILLKPTIIKDDRAWVRDLDQSSERVRDFLLPPLSVAPR
ncbi:MAG: secretin N-terminal domain-containing protein [Rhodocyclaceae bacterium]|nr:secretin N-terminal domain-containing protein [Rhodocyclaceae bacterium]